MAAVIFTILMVLPIIIGLSVVAGTTALLKKA